MAEKLVVIGNGMAGMRTVEELLALAPDHYDITVFGNELHGNYNRIMLSPVLSGEKTVDEIMINDLDWYATNNIDLRSGLEVTMIDRVSMEVVASDGSRTPYDRLLLATGSNPFVIPLPGHDLNGVITFRDIWDVERMIDASNEHQHAVVIGGGLLGLEAANGLMTRGMDVTVIHLMDTLMERQLDEAAGDLLRISLEARGLKILTGAETETILGSDRVEAVKLKDGRTVKADLVVMAVGIRPNATLAKKAGLACDRGVLVSDTLQTYDPSIYAVGECVQHRGATYGLVAPLFDQAKVCANHLACRGHSAYGGSQTSTKLKVTGIDLFSAGDFGPGEGREDIVFRDAARGIYKRLVVEDDKLIGTVLYGDTGDGAWYFNMVQTGESVVDIRDRMIFGQALAANDLDPSNAVAGLPDTAEICGCNGVCKGTIVSAIQEGHTTLQEIRTHTKASASCGSCTGLVEQLLTFTLGDDYSGEPTINPMCGCTTLGHDAVRRLIKVQSLKTIPQAMQVLDWSTPDGCASCRPALNYYLVCEWPGEYVDDAQSRFINERVHANIQKDGTFSVIPRMWGGVTTSAELRAIADVADKFSIPTVKVTGGQRIDLLGVKKEDLPAVWRDLNDAGMVSGHAYGKALRTVKTCVGSEWCRFGTQDSTGMGVLLEKLTWGSWMPHKFKMAVSGCPRNCAESTIKDFGIIAVDSGWELHVGGNGGITVRVTDFLCKVETEEELLDHCFAFIQFYRENAYYLERTAPWIDRIGLDAVVERIVDDVDGRAILAERFRVSQSYAQTDPWAERTTQKPGLPPKLQNEFLPLEEKVPA